VLHDVSLTTDLSLQRLFFGAGGKEEGGAGLNVALPSAAATAPIDG
jgi:hypothetical protein